MTDFKTTLNQSLKDSLDQLTISLALNQIEIGPLGAPLTIDFYEKWLSNQSFGSMKYLQDHFTAKKNPQLLAGGQTKSLHSVISVSQSYFPVVKPHATKLPARTATYAQNEDYHYWLKDKLANLITALKEKYPDEIFLAYVDSGPVLERNWAYQNGLGWFGKNTCLIHPQHGSLFFVAEILTSLITPAESILEPLPDFCGKCQKCIDICPTNALVAPKQMNAELCISYLTIEAKTVPPLELRKKIGDWFYGCDLCQSVCPWNEKVFRLKNIESSHDTSTELLLGLSNQEESELLAFFRWLLKTSHKQIQKRFLGTPMSRAGAKGLKRNALIVIANRKLIALKADVEALNLDEFAELKAWTLQQLNTKPLADQKT